METLRFIIQSIRKGRVIPYAKWILRYALKGKWALGSELAYWEVRLRRYPTNWHQPMFKDVYVALDLLNQTFKEHPIILEMGPGPRSRLTEGYEKKLYDLVSVDPLAEEYMKHFNGKPFLLKGTGEELDMIFPMETFHMTYASNALDHTQNPVKCFRHLYNLTKVGGLIMVQGNVDEGSRIGWVSLHQHDISLDAKKQLIIKNRDGSQTVATKNLALDVAHLRLDLLEGNPWFSITYRRLQNGGR